MALGWLWWRAWARLVAGDAAQVCAGVALGDIDFGFAWQAWHFVTSTFVLRGRRGMAWHLWLWAGSGGALGRACVRLVAGDAAQVCVAGAALGGIYFGLAWQVWHLETSTFVLRGMRGTWSHPPSFCGSGFVTDFYTFTRLRHRFLTHTTFTRLCRDFALLVS